MTTTTTSVLIKIELHDIINMCGYDLIWDMADEAVRHLTGNDTACLVDLTIEPESVEDDIVVIRVTGYVEAEEDV